MRLRRGKKSDKLDLLELSDVEKMKLMKAVKESLRQKVVEAKLWQSFVEADDLTINGEAIHREGIQLKGLSVGELLKSM